MMDRKFLSIIVQNCSGMYLVCYSPQTLPSKLWCPELFELLGRCILEPSSVGFDMTDVEVINQLPEEVCSFVVPSGLGSTYRLYAVLCDFVQLSSYRTMRCCKVYWP